MDERRINQGSIIYGIRSNKYPSSPCYGIIINARCDIAQGKISKYHYLVGVDADVWLASAVGYWVAYKGHIGTLAGTVKQKALELDLNGEALIGMEDASIEIILSDALQNHPNDRKIEKKVNDLKGAIARYHLFYRDGMNDDDRKRAIKESSRQAVSCIKEIDSGTIHHYYYLPQNAYLTNGVMGKGIVVDLLEIDSISLDDAKRITDPFKEKITFDNLPELPDPEELRQIAQRNDEAGLQKVLRVFSEYQRMISSYWLIDDSCFVEIEGTIQPPFCEHLMQRFSNVFVRIGIDNPAEDDFKRLVQSITDEVE